MADWPDRLNRFIDALREGRRPERGQASTSEELEELRMAASIMGSRAELAQPDPEFLESLRSRLQLAQRKKPRVSRAGLLRAAGYWTAGVASGLAVAWGISSRRLTPTEPVPATDAALPSGKWFAVVPLADIAQREVMSFDAGAVPTFLIREGDTVRAMSRICTHMACLLHYKASDQEFACPCHGATFDLNGRVDNVYGLKLPPLPPIDVRVVNGTVYVLGA